MWNDFLVGKRCSCRHTGAHAVWDCGNLSENKCEFWYNLHEYDIGGIITKNSKEGKKIVAMVKELRDNNYDKKMIKKIESHVMKVALSAMSPTKILQVIKRVEANAFKEGQEDKAREIRRALHCQKSY